MSKKLKIGLFAWFVWRFLPPCKDVAFHISHSRDRDPTLRDKLVMKLHVWSCVACKRYSEQIQFLDDVFELKRNGDSSLGAGLVPEAANRIKAALSKRQD